MFLNTQFYYLSTFIGLPPMRAKCILPSGLTQVGESQTVVVTKCGGNQCFKQDIFYEAAMPQILALIKSSSSCSQTIDFQCFSAPLKVMIFFFMQLQDQCFKNSIRKRQNSNQKSKWMY